MIRLNQKGLLLVISGPSGVGKGTVVREVLARRKDTVLSVSATTRKIREGEVDGVDYHYMTEEAFEEIRKSGGFLETATFCGSSYGTLKNEVFARLDKGSNVILEIDVQGAMEIRSKYPEGVFIFITPPTYEELYRRLLARNTETPEIIEKRFNHAKREFTYIDKYNYLVENNNLHQAASDVCSIIDAERLRMERCYDKVYEKLKLGQNAKGEKNDC